MKVLITGAAGQLGRALLATAPTDAVVVASDRIALDITDAEQVWRAVREAAPDWIINAAAYTAVDRAESEAELAFAINGGAVANLARAAAETGARLVQVSTDFVFDGRSSSPYLTDAAPNPLSSYGHSKLAGEAAAGEGAVIVRTAWVYAAQGANFVHTMLRLMRERDELRVVADQIGSPTWATGLAQTIWHLTAADKGGIWHHTDSGVASWYDFAVAIMEEALALGLLNRPISVMPIRTAKYPAPARRPAFSVLDCGATTALFGVAAPHWRVNLRHMLKEVKAHG
jgi:dTDP-4-dehydrorhamnose reductase